MTVYYVRPVNGLDTNTGTTFAAAFLSAQKAVDTAIAGDEIRLCAEATETVLAPIDLDTNNGIDTGKIRVAGYDGTNGEIPEKYIIQAAPGFAGGSVVLRTEGFGAGIIWRDIEFDGNNLAAQAFDNAEGQFAHQSTYIRCLFHRATENGFRSKEASRAFFYACDFFDNGETGYKPYQYQDGRADFSYCRFYNNTDHGAYIDDAENQFRSCEFYSNGLDGLYIWARADTTLIESCVAYGNGRHGINHASSTANRLIVQQNSFVGNGGYGISFASTDMDHELLFCDFNHDHNNTSGATNLANGLLGENNVSGDPLFKSTVAGSEDFSPSSNSPLNGAGIRGGYIGSKPVQMTAGLLQLSPQASLRKKLHFDHEAQNPDKDWVRELIEIVDEETASSSTAQASLRQKLKAEDTARKVEEYLGSGNFRKSEPN